MNKYTKISGLILLAAIMAPITILLLVQGDLHPFYIFLLILEVLLFIIGAIISIIGLIKTKSVIQGIILFFFLLPIIPIAEVTIKDAISANRKKITDEELLESYEKLTGIRPLAIIEPTSYRPIFLLDIVRPNYLLADSIKRVEGEIILGCEDAKVHVFRSHSETFDGLASELRIKNLLRYIPIGEDCFRIEFYVLANAHFDYRDGIKERGLAKDDNYYDVDIANPDIKDDDWYEYGEVKIDDKSYYIKILNLYYELSNLNSAFEISETKDSI